MITHPIAAQFKNQNRFLLQNFRPFIYFKLKGGTLKKGLSMFYYSSFLLSSLASTFLPDADFTSRYGFISAAYQKISIENFCNQHPLKKKKKFDALIVLQKTELVPDAELERDSGYSQLNYHSKDLNNKKCLLHDFLHSTAPLKFQHTRLGDREIRKIVGTAKIFPKCATKRRCCIHLLESAYNGPNKTNTIEWLRNFFHQKAFYTTLFEASFL